MVHQATAAQGQQQTSGTATNSGTGSIVGMATIPAAGALISGGAPTSTTTSGTTTSTSSSSQPNAAPAVVTGVTPAQGNASSTLSQTINSGALNVSNLGVCLVIDPTRKEAPWHGSMSAFPQVYDANMYVCVDGNFLCPTTAPLRCMYACYSSSLYSCSNGMLSSN